MNQILALREKRAKLWDAAKAFLDTKRGTDGMISAEDNATYEKMEADVVSLGREIDRLERQSIIDRELNAPTSKPLTSAPLSDTGTVKSGKATDEYRGAFWRVMRDKAVPYEITNALKIGQDDHGGYLAPDEYERTLVEALEEQNIFRQLAHVITTSSGDRKIPVVASKGNAAWIPEVKAHLRLQHADEDAYIGSLIEQAQSAAEDFCRVSFSEEAPLPVRLAVLLMISHYFENRDNPDKQVYLAMRMAFENLLYPHRDVTKFF